MSDSPRSGGRYDAQVIKRLAVQYAVVAAILWLSVFLIALLLPNAVGSVQWDRLVLVLPLLTAALFFDILERMVRKGRDGR